MKMEKSLQQRIKKSGHIGQIVTTRKTIVDFIKDIQLPVASITVKTISDGLNGGYDKLKLYSVCSRLYYLSRLIYVGKNGISKLRENQYRERLFEVHVETLEEVRYILERNNDGGTKESIQGNHVYQVFRCLKIIEKIWSRSIACVCEQIYIPELAYALDYVIKRKGELPEPLFQGKCSMFPQNYENYNYTEGIAKCFENVMESVF